MPPADIDRLRSVKTLAQLLAYLRDELDWPIGSDDVEDVTFTYDPAELGFDAEATVRIKEVKQLRPLHASQPWGVFWVNFEKKRLPVVMLRRALGHLVVKKRAAAGRADQKAWRMNDLLFISAYGENEDRAITFAHFSQDQGAPGELPVLKVLGWDEADTVQHVADVHRALTEKLRWPGEPADVPEWRRRWAEAFTLRHREVIRTTELLVDELASLATNIRDAVLFAVSRETDRGPWRRMLAAFQATLIRDLTEESFADVIAQTVSYGLLTARFSAPGAISLRNLVDMVPRTNPFLRELLEHFLSSAGRHGLFDVDEVGIDEVVSLLNRANAEAIKHDFGDRTSGEDPVIHFYEHFLNAYNKQLKIERGVFYTPQPVVSYIVRSVHELLQTEFGLADGLADTATWGEMVKRHPGLKLPPLTDEPGEKRTISPDEPFVQILDPATGTATFLVEVIDVIHRTLEAKWKKQRLTDAQQRDAWNDYVPQHLLPRLHAFELMMAPYAIAHMKIGLKLAETGYGFGTKERAHIYLTNSLEPWVKQLPLVGLDALAHEAAAVNEIKRHKRFTVVIGNPPYAGISANHGEWITRLIDAYRFVDGQPLEEKKVWLKNDYVKFLRLSQFTVDTSGRGVVGMITDHSYLDSPTFRGMRNSLLRSSEVVRIVNLHGNSKRRESSPTGGVDENVFDITQGVAISLFARRGGAGRITSYADMWGSRQEKYRQLVGASLSSTEWTAIDPRPAFYSFADLSASSSEEYGAGWFITDVFTLGSNGVQTSRDSLVLASSRSELAERFEWIRNSSTPDAEIHKTCEVEDKSFWQLRNARRALRADRSWIERIVPYTYRPFDSSWIYASSDFVHRLRREVMRHMESPNRALCVGRAGLVVEGPWNLVFATNTICDHNLFYRGSSLNCPLYRYDDDLVAQTRLGRWNRVHNIGHRFSVALAQTLNLDLDRKEGLPSGLAPEDIFHYAYAIFHSPGYRSRYAEFLKIDFPRLPLTQNLELFRSLARLGGELTALHLLESPKLDKPLTEFIGGRNPEVEKISWSKKTVWMDKAQTVGFRGVPEDVWNFHIGGYQVCEKWLKDRKGRTLSKDDIAHYQKIVVALAETIRLMKEIDAVIEHHGGWPGAFAQGIPSRDAVGASDADAGAGASAVSGQQALLMDDQEPASADSDGEAGRSMAIDDLDTDELICTVRQLFNDGNVRNRDTAIGELAGHVGFARVGSRIRESLDNAVRTATRRGILENDGSGLRIHARSLEEYDRAFLKDQFLASLQGKAWTERDDAVQTFARWMGFRRTGSTIADTARSLINGLIREERLESDGSRIRRCG